MKKKIIVSIAVSLLVLLYSYVCFASNEIIGGVSGNIINDTSNIVKDTADGIGKATESIVNGVSNIAGDTGNAIQDGAKNVKNSMSNIVDNSIMSSNSEKYNAVSVNANSPNTFLGMDSMTWWWLIIGAICALLVVLLWNKMNNKTDNDE